MTVKNKKLITKGRCINFGLCDKADTKEIIEISVGEDFVCPCCAGPLDIVKEQTNWRMYVIIATVVIGGATGGYFALKGGGGPAKPEEVLVSSLTLNQSSVTLKESESKMLTVSIDPGGATNKAVEWSSSDTLIAIVDGNGKITAIKKGDAKIEVKATDGSNQSATATVEVQGGIEGTGGDVVIGKGSGTTEVNKRGDFPCGKYEGKTVNGKPHGMGTFTYNARTLIDDHKMIYAERGDYITGSFREGKIVSVHLYDSGGNLKQTVIPQQPTSICR